MSAGLWDYLTGRQERAGVSGSVGLSDGETGESGVSGSVGLSDGETGESGVSGSVGLSDGCQRVCRII